MQQPEHLLRTANTGSTSRRALSIVIVAGLHVLVIAAFISGLANRVIEKLPEDIIAKVEPPKLPEKAPPPPPPPKLEQPPPPYVPPPDIVIQSETAPTNTITTQSKIASVPPPKPAGISAPALISGGAKCQSSYYPPIATRLNQEGTTTVAVHVGADGSVTGVEVTNSSGHDSLDQAALRCIQHEWHFKPAMQNGVPVQTTKQYAIKWQLQG